MNKHFRLLPIVTAFVLAFLMGTQGAQAKPKQHQWQRGILTGIDLRDASRLYQGTSITRTVSIYSVDDGHFIWKLDRETTRRDKPLDVTINGPIEFAIEGQRAYMKDDQGEEHSLSVESKSLKMPLTP